MEATTSRIQIEVTAAEKAALEDFRVADRRSTLSNAIVAAALLGLDAWRQRGRPKEHRLAPVPGIGSGSEQPASPEVS
jgi:hypothetical protein